jgi:meso-butanediol dehydrogenase/(S,S)-butanediol dehydrogenase/diacetyl reductase
MARFDGKKAFLTGAGSGIGRATALKLSSEGAAVVGFDVNADALAETGQLVTDAGGVFHASAGDVRSRDVCHQAIDAAADNLGGLDIVVNIAGIARAEHMVDVTEEQWHQMLDINLSGVFFISQAAIPHLLKTKGSLINIASNAGLMGQAYTVAYCATKGAVVNMTKAMAMEYVKEDIRINVVAPGGVLSNLTMGFQMPDDVDFDLMGRYTATRGMLDPMELANAIAFVASDEASGMHGSVMSVDAGITAG